MFKLCALLATLLARAAHAQRDTTTASVLRLQIDNDLIGLRGAGPPPDYDYTHGTRISFTLPNGTSAIALGQEIYTPRHNADAPMAGDRPYAAWLYGALVAMRRRGSTLDSVELRGGVTGPLALGEQLQNGVHRLLHNELERGWAHQIPARLAVDLRADRSMILLGRSVDSMRPSRFLGADLGGVAGSVRQEIHLTGAAYWGLGDAARAGADAPLVRRPGGWYLETGYRQEYVLRDLFVDGVRGGPAASRVPWVGEGFLEAGANLSHWSISYRHVARSREYRAANGGHAYGSIAISRRR
jgi:lipid A 3-O-deacylase